MTAKEQLGQGLARLGIQLTGETVERLCAYVSLLGKWNRIYNLTAIREPGKIVSHHVLDSLAVLSHVNADTIADIGSGAGLPGIPIAVAKPDVRVVLVEVNHKKSAFLRQAIAELQLDNVEVVTERAEKWQPSERFGVVISRAFSDLVSFVEIAGHLCRPDGVLLAMKGLYPHEELSQLPAEIKLQSVETIDVPGLRAGRHLVIMRPGRSPR